jgi:hypothetical protein
MIAVRITPRESNPPLARTLQAVLSLPPARIQQLARGKR